MVCVGDKVKVTKSGDYFELTGTVSRILNDVHTPGYGPVYEVKLDDRGFSMGFWDRDLELIVKEDPYADDWYLAFNKLQNAVRALYYSACWYPDRKVDAGKLWTDVRDAAGFEPGHSPTPAFDDELAEKPPVEPLINSLKLLAEWLGPRSRRIVQDAINALSVL